ncbi:LCP family protein [Planomicrobium sp. YIM 101495]|uniref:LCP family protein n=1 Tax=Planomicrobium sp. YIM 101495 TaxID=2665160 RepID=UPI0012B800A8|nr:LCP family protein [Planomicrobium sp. YIM 101495]MTD29796.1 LytR family transcriptional regulator [Planomicrobium sp. YIM 101495]
MEEELQTGRRERRKKKRSRRRKLFLLFLLVVLIAGIYTIFQYVSGYLSADSEELTTGSFDADPAHPDYENILVLGVDARNEGPSRTDTMILVSHNKKTDEVKLTSFMRDIYADIPDYQSYKLNTAFYLGGVDLLADTLRHMFGVKIHHYAMVDFQNFEQIVDIAAPNGVEIDVEKAMSEKIGVSLEPGVQDLNGKELLGYARFRADNEGDFGRVRRQQQVITAMKDELISVSAIPKLPKLAGAVQGYMETDMKMGEQVKLAAEVALFGGGEFERMTVPIEDGYNYATYPQAGSVLEIDLEANRNALEEFLGQELD